MSITFPKVQALSTNPNTTVGINPNLPAIPNPNVDLKSVATVLLACKQAIESLGGTRGAILDRAVTFNDLIRVGLSSPQSFMSPTGTVPGGGPGTGGGGAGFPEAPVDSTLYGRIDTTWQRALALAGGTMTGPIVLAGNATAPLQPVALQQLSTTVGAYLPLAGGTLTGPLTLAANGTVALHAVTLQQLNAGLTGKEDKVNKGIASGYAPLDAGSKVPAAFLPAYVDDVVEFADLAAFPAPGTAGLIYVALDTNKIYRWSGSTYVEISPSPGSTDAVPEGAVNLYFTNARAAAAAPVQSFNTRTGAVTLSSGDVSGASGLLTTGGAMTGGLNFGNTAMAAVGDTSRHISLYGGSGTSGTFGFNVTGGRINYSVPLVAHVHSFNVAGVEEVRITNTGINLLNTGWVSGLLAPTAADHATNKGYVDAADALRITDAPNDGKAYIRQSLAWAQAASTALPVVVGDVPPTPVDGQLWFDSVGLQLYIRYNDGNSSQWTSATNQFGLTSYAPLASPVFSGDARCVTPPPGDNDTSIATTAFVQQAAVTATAGAGAGNVGRNLIHNSLFTVWQRGTSFSAGGYTADRWQLSLGPDTGTVSQTVAADSQRASIGDEAVTNLLSVSFTGSAAANGLVQFLQPIEGLRRLAGKTVTVSFWASSNNSSGLKLGVNLYLAYGTGGSPSTNDYFQNAQVLTGVYPWTRYSLTFTVPSLAGKTLGTNNNDATLLVFMFSCGSNSTFYPGFGAQSGLIQLWGVQCEIGSAMTQLEKIEYADDLRHCQRFYYQGVPPLRGVGSGTTNVGRIAAMHPVPMRAVPTVTLVTPLPVWDGVTATTVTSIQTVYATTTAFELDAVSVAALAAGRPAIVYQGAGGLLTVSADL
jgi:hypothetical protein